MREVEGGKEIFEVTFDISPEQHVRIQAAFQKYVEDAVSKTINLPEEASPKDIEKAYLLAREIAQKIEKELTYPGVIRITVLRETRAIEYAK